MQHLRANGDNTGGSAGKIDAADYTVWKANFGAHSGSGALASGTTSVSEPSTWILAVMTVGLICLYRSLPSRHALLPQVVDVGSEARRPGRKGAIPFNCMRN